MYVAIRPTKKEEKSIKGLMKFYRENTATKALIKAAQELPTIHEQLLETQNKLEDIERKYNSIIRLLNEKSSIEKEINSQITGESDDD